MTKRHHCPACNSQRKTDRCQKCGTACTEPHPDWDYPELPDVNKIREIARNIGYAIGEHGTKERDLDLIAVPWTEEAAKLLPQDVMYHIAAAMGGRVIEVEKKPLGRWACTIQLDGWFKPIDLSVAPVKR